MKGQVIILFFPTLSHALLATITDRPGADHKPCLAREADTSSASVASWDESTMSMLPVEDTLLRCLGDVSPDTTGDLYTISAPWSVLALAFSRKVSLWVSICKRGGEGG